MHERHAPAMMRDMRTSEKLHGVGFVAAVRQQNVQLCMQRLGLHRDPVANPLNVLFHYLYESFVRQRSLDLSIGKLQ
jgi:hypothetical protein